MNWILRTGNFLFKYRSFTPVPLILVVFIFFRPVEFGENNFLITIAGVLVMILGELIRVFAVGFSFAGTSGRENFLRADHLNSSGIYSVVRNPLYIGNLFIYSGILLIYSNMYALIFFDVLLIIQYFFIVKAEEDFLLRTYGKEYAKYKEVTNSVFPTIKKYIKPENKFNSLKVLLKENDSIFNALFISGLIVMYKSYLKYGMIKYTFYFVIYFGVLVFSYIFIKIVKKKIL